MIGIKRPNQEPSTSFTINMAAPLLLSTQVAFVGVCVLFLPVLGASDDFCQTVCGCLGSIVDCSKQGLEKIPSDIPKWVVTL